MKKYLIFFFFLIILAACRKDTFSVEAQQGSDNKIAFGLQENNIDSYVTTKVTPVTSVSSIYWYAVDCWEPFYSGFGNNAKQCSVVSSKVNTGYYWPENANLFFFGSNMAFYYDEESTCCIIDADNAKDVLVFFDSNDYEGYTKDDNLSFQLTHLFARTGALTLNSPSGFTIVGTPEWYLESYDDPDDYDNPGGISGTYDMCCSSWWDFVPLSKTRIYSTSDLYLIEGTYQLTVSYTLQKGNWQKSFTKSSDIYLCRNYVNKIDATAPSETVDEIIFNVTVEAWRTANVNVSLN